MLVRHVGLLGHEASDIGVEQFHLHDRHHCFYTSKSEKNDIYGFMVTVQLSMRKIDKLYLVIKPAWQRCVNEWCNLPAECRFAFGVKGTS